MSKYKIVINDKFGRTPTETAIAYFKVLSRGWIEENFRLTGFLAKLEPGTCHNTTTRLNKVFPYLLTICKMTEILFPLIQLLFYFSCDVTGCCVPCATLAGRRRDGACVLELLQLTGKCVLCSACSSTN